MATPRTRLLLSLGLLIGVAGAVSLWPREESPEEKIRRLIIQMARAAERKDLAFIMDQVGTKFSSPEGWNKQELKVFLAGQIFRGNWVRVFPVDIRVSVAGPVRATFSGKFVLGRSQALELRELAKQSQIQAYKIDGRLECEDDGRWRVVYAEHHAVDPMQFL